jgi:branched-chain amino acid aminotransferase
MAQAKPKYAYFQGQVVPLEDAKISVMTHALHYGTAVFAGMRAYWNDDEQQLFMYRPNDHFERLLQSATLMRMNLDHTVESLKDALTQLLRAENFHENCYIRPLAYKSEERLGISLHDVADDLTIIAMPVGQFVVRSDDDGIHLCISGWKRVDDNMIPARGKVSGAYANSTLVKSDAMLAGFDDALILSDDGHISEASGANVFIIRKGVALTPPVNANVLEGITRRSVIQWMQDDLGVEVIERDIDRTEVYLAEEIFLCGTGAQIAPVSRIDHRVIGAGKIGPITRRVRDLYFQVVTGREPKYRSWVEPVFVAEEAGVR